MAQLSDVYADFGPMPVYMGTVASPESEDEFHPMHWGRRESDGLFGVLSWPSLSKVYLKNHNELVGTTWKKHLLDFANFVATHATGSVLEIGAGHGLLGAEVKSLRPSSADWHVIEPNPLSLNSLGELITGWFPKDLPENIKFETIVHSHVFEHQESPLQFAKSMAETLGNGGRVILSLPNMEAMAKNGDLNMLMFEHLTYLPMQEVETVMSAAGFEFMAFQHFNSHSIFMCFEKRSPRPENFSSTVSVAEFRGICENFKNGLLTFTSKSNHLMKSSNRTIYLFGAHIFSQYLIASGLSAEKILFVLDNNEKKQGERLYGTSLEVRSPKILESEEPCTLILPTASYEKEILTQLQAIAPEGTEILGIRTGLTLVS